MYIDWRQCQWITKMRRIINKTIVLEELGKGKNKSLTVDVEILYEKVKGDRYTPDDHQYTIISYSIQDFDTDTQSISVGNFPDHFAWDVLDQIAYDLISNDLHDHFN